jgi:hypothetical protein
MKLIPLFLLLASAAFCQSLTLTSSAATVKPGSQILLTVGFTDAVPSANVAGVQWTLVAPPGLIASAPTSLVSNKPTTCNLATCLIVGDSIPLNSAPLTSENLAAITLSFPNSVGPGPLTFSLSNTLGATVAGASVALNSPTVTVQILSPYDLNGDGVVNLLDVQLAAQQADGLLPCTTANFGSGCNISAVELVILAALANVQ